MNLFNYLFTPTGILPATRQETAPVAQHREDVQGVPSTTDPKAEENQPPKSGNWQANIVTPYGMKSLMVPTWFRCVTLIMQTMGQMVVQHQTKNFKGGNFDESMVGEGRRLNYLMQVRPNPLMTASQMQEQIEFRKIYYGNAYVYIQRDAFGVPVSLWLCTSGSYLPEENAYTLTFPAIYQLSRTVKTDAANVLHFRNVIMGDGMTYGLPTIHFAMRALQIAATGDDQALQDLGKGGKYKVLIQEQEQPQLGTRGRAKRGELKSMTEEFARDWMANDVVLLDNVADAKVISQTAQQLELLGQRGYSAEDLCRMMGVPKVMAMIGDGGSYKMPEHATQEFLLRNIQPRIRNHEDELNFKFIPFDKFSRERIHICESALLRLDEKGQAEIDKLHLETGWSPNEIRRQRNMPAISGGDAHYVSTNLAEVGSEKLRGVSPKSAQREEKGGQV